jgi:hypothetical protein
VEKQTVATVVSATATGDEPSMLITTNALDRTRDIVEPEGCDYAPCKLNPVVGYGHFQEEPLPVGSTTRLDLVPGKGIRATWKWLKNDAFADRVRNAFEQGILRAASIGFLPIEPESNGQGGFRFTKWQLLEWSLVAVPANPDAVRTLKSLKLWPEDESYLEVNFTPERRARRDSGVLEIVDPLPDRSSHSHSVFDVDLDQVRDLIAESVARPEAMRAIADDLRVSIRTAVKSAMARRRGRVDDF